MRSLFLVVLLALTLPGLAVDICPGGSLPNEFDLEVVPGQTYTATDCTLNGMIQVDFVANSTAPTTVSIKNSIIRYVLRINLIQEGYQNLIGPLYITVENNVFEQGAGFYTRNALPPHSVLTFQNNQMSSDGSFIALDTSYIQFMRIRNLIFYYNSTFNVIGNTMTVNAVQEGAWTRLINFDGESVSVRGDGKGTMNILSNTITVNGTHFGSFIQIPFFEMIDGSALNINSNIFTATNTLAFQHIVEAESISGQSGRNLLSMSNNKVNIYSGEADQRIFSFGTITNVNMDLNDNIISTNHYYLFRCYDPFVPESYTNIIGNTFAASSAPVTVSPIYFPEYQFVDNSTLTVARNTVTAPSVEATDAFLVNVDVATIGSRTAIKYCGNTLPWTNSSTPGQQLFPSVVASLLSYDSTACIGVTTVASTSTRSPNSFMLTSAATALVVCLLAILVALQ